MRPYSTRVSGEVNVRIRNGNKEAGLFLERAWYHKRDQTIWVRAITARGKFRGAATVKTNDFVVALRHLHLNSTSNNNLLIEATASIKQAGRNRDIHFHTDGKQISFQFIGPLGGDLGTTKVAVADLLAALQHLGLSL